MPKGAKKNPKGGAARPKKGAPKKGVKVAVAVAGGAINKAAKKQANKTKALAANKAAKKK